MNRYYRIVIKLFIALCVVFAAGACRADDFAPDPPPQFDKGWNLVSVPCDISIVDFKRDMKEDSLKVYGWNGAGYEEAAALERGRGYFINVKSVLNPLSVCKPKAANESLTVSFKAGWNLIGNPYHKAATFTQLLGDAAGKEDAGIFELKGDKAIPVRATAQAKPWSGYWLYTSSDVVMPIVNIYKLEIRAYKEAGRKREAAYPVVVLKGKELYFLASAVFKEGPGKNETRDVTADAEWGVSGGGIGVFAGGGDFVAGDAVGAGAVSAEYDGVVSNLIEFAVVEKQPDVKCDNLILAYSWYDIFSHDPLEIPFHAYSNIAFQNNASEEFACFHDMPFNGSLQEEALFCDNLDIDATSIVYEPGENISLKAYCANVNCYPTYPTWTYYTGITDVSSYVEWKIKDESLISMNADGTVTAKAVGMPEISAAYGDKESAKLHFRTMNKRAILKSIEINKPGERTDDSLVTCAGNRLNSRSGCGTFDHIIYKGKSGRLAAYGDYDIALSDGKKDIVIDINSNGGFRSKTGLTEKVEWKSTDDNIGSVSADGLFTAKSGGSIIINASLDGFTSNSRTIKVYDCDDEETLAAVCGNTDLCSEACGKAGVIAIPLKLTLTRTNGEARNTLTCSAFGNVARLEGRCQYHGMNSEWTVIESGDSMPCVYTEKGHFLPGCRVNGEISANASNSVEVVNIPPVGSITAGGPASGAAPLTVNFEGSCADSDGKCAFYHWNFGDGHNTGLQDQNTTSHIYTASGTYTAILTVSDNDGGSALSFFPVSVTENSGRKGLILGGAGEDVAYTAQQTSDGGYFVAGYTMSSGEGQRDYWALKLDASGKQMWSKTYGGAGDDLARAALQTPDGGYLVGGYSNSPGVSVNGAYDIWLVKLDASGGVSWTRTYGASGDDRCHSMTQTSDGGYAILAYTTSEGAGNFDYEIIKLDASGNMKWKKTYGGAGRDDPNSIRQTADGGYIMTGLTYSYGAGDSDAWLVKTDADGRQMWAKTFGGAGFDQGISVQQTEDGGYIAAAYSGSVPTAGGFDAWLIKVDSSGNVMWDKKYGEADKDLAYSVKAAPDGGYIAAGMWNSDLLAMKIDSAGNEAWRKTFGGAGVDFAFETSATADGGYILAGATGSYSGGYDAWVLKLDGAGNAVW